MTGVYVRALGEAADDLHPKVRERYDIGPDDGIVCVGEGRMDVNHGVVALPALYAMATRDLLFPETGEDVPFTVTTVGYRTEAGHEALTTRREFEFPNRRRRFDSVTVWDDDRGRLLDVLGTGGRIVSELDPGVEDGALVVGGGRQWLRIGGRYVRLPGPLAASVEVRDRYDEAADHYEVTGTVENALAGRVFRYEGTFTQEFREDDDLPGDLRPARPVPSLPPA